MRPLLLPLFMSVLLLAAFPARAEFIISNAILEFQPDGQGQKDIEIISRSKDNDYVVTEVSEIINPGAANQSERPFENPEEAGLLVTPDKVVLSAGSRRVLRFVLMKEPGEQERIYYVTVKPVIPGLSQNNKLGLKVLVGYRVMVIVRPATTKADFSAQRTGKTLTFRNTGNTNLLLQQGQQCASTKDCRPLAVERIHAGQSKTLTLHMDAPVSYSIWDGQNTTEKQFP